MTNRKKRIPCMFYGIFLGVVAVISVITYLEAMLNIKYSLSEEVFSDLADTSMLLISVLIVTGFIFWAWSCSRLRKQPAMQDDVLIPE